MPLLISGELPGRGVKDIAYLLKHRIELAIQNKAQLGGFTLDLKKAFNTFPRWPIVFLWRKLGIPQWVCDFWLHSLMRMQRFPHLHGCLGSPVESTTGAPEGNSLTVVAMLALATAFHWSITNDAVTSHGYADNWGWSTFKFESHKTTFLSTLKFTSSLRLQIDFEKSWHWSIAKEFPPAWTYPHFFLRVTYPSALKPMLRILVRGSTTISPFRWEMTRIKLLKPRVVPSVSNTCHWTLRPRQP